MRAHAISSASLIEWALGALEKTFKNHVGLPNQKCALVNFVKKYPLNPIEVCSREVSNKQEVFAVIMNDESFMKVAIENAKLNEHHFGAIIVKNNEIIAKAGKMPKGDPGFHAETHVILEACEKLRTRNLQNCTLYSTCEPCPMCFYMAWVTNVSKIVYGATIQDCIKLGIPEIRVTANFLNKKRGQQNRTREEISKRRVFETAYRTIAR